MSNDLPTHLDIFSGIGGFAIAAQWAGFETVGFCESGARCRTFLEKTWGRPVHADIRTFDAKPYHGISLLTGGPPCQPASRAGKQGGKEDDRWLWPPTLRVLDEAQPDCVVFENPPGILDVGIDGILSEMGRLGYEVQCFDIPACAVDSPQLRHRIWFVGFLADSEREGRKPASQLDSQSVESEQQTSRWLDVDGRGKCMADTRRERSGQDEQGRRPDRRAVDRRDCAGQLADASERGRRQGSENAGRARGGTSEEGQWLRPTDRTGSQWQNSVWVPCADGKLCRAPSCSICMAARLPGCVSTAMGKTEGEECETLIYAHKSLLAALGNSVVPEVAYQILKNVRGLITAPVD